MGRDSSHHPIQQHHRKQHQKELQRNKQQRTKARDEKVVQTKTVSSVKEEIRGLEKRGKNHKLQPTEQKKLQRLKKELKLVQDAAEKAKLEAGQNSHHERIRPQQQKPLTELDDPRKSVYYDEKFNPYGAAPPGRPRMYHQRGGGVTMDIRLAVVPGEEPPPPPPRNEHRNNLRESYPYRHSNKKNSGSRSEPTSETPRSALDSSSDTLLASTKRAPEDFSNEKDDYASDDITPKGMEETGNAEQEGRKESAQKSSAPLSVPTLPPPSQAVQRAQRGLKKRGDMADIWASHEEVEYERRVNHIDIEADDWGSQVPKKKKKPKKVPLEYFYKDRAGLVQGPFTKTQMLRWKEAGYFPLTTTLIKTTRNDEWVPIGELSSLESNQTAVETPSASLEDRIATLKHDKQAIIQKNDELHEHDVSVQARIAALKEKQAVSEGETGADIQDTITGGYRTSHRSHDDDSIHNVANEKSASAEAEESMIAAHPAPYVIASEDEGDVGPVAYPVVPYPTGEDEPGTAVDTYAVAPYPMVDEDVEKPGFPIYSVEDEEGVAAYIVDASYPVGEDHAYPVTDAYPSVSNEQNSVATEFHPGPVAMEQSQGVASSRTKKTIKVDSALVALLPSHLQKKKRKTNSQDAKAATDSQPKKVKSKNSSGDDKPNDDYEKFMQEIEGLH